MIDLHSHLLPVVDDGAASLEEALSLARCAVEDGITVSVMTPHVHPGRYGNSLSTLEPHFVGFQAALSEAGIPLQIRLGGEVRIGPEALDLLLENRLPFLGELDGYRILLLEFPHQGVPVGSSMFIEKLMRLRIRPLIAHPERNKRFMNQPDELGRFLDLGCWVQLTAGSLAGRFGEAAQQVASRFLKNGWAHVIATDAHNLQHRPPKLAEGFKVATTLVGEAKAREMVDGLPRRILGLT